VSRGVLVAGIGNIFLSDDGFGVEVANRLASQPMPAGVRVADFGIRGVHLAYELLEGYDTLVLVDAISRGDPPGTVSILEAPAHPEADDGDGVLEAMDAHGMQPAAVLAMLSDLGGAVDRVLVVGCEPESLEDGIGLSEPVTAAIPAAVDAVRELISTTSKGASS
jgi:hydrogenase maturation protease